MSPYSGRTSAAREAAATQLNSLRRFLTNDEYVLDAGGVVVRTVGVPIGTHDARRLLALRNVILVIRGDAQAGGSAAYFHGNAYFRDDAPYISLNRYELSIYTDTPPRSRVRRIFVGDVIDSATHEEGDLEMQRFVSVSLRIGHFQQLAKVLLVLLSEKALEHPHRLRRQGILILPDSADPDLTEDLQMRVLQLQAASRRREDARTVLEDLEQQVRKRDIGGPRAANWLVAQWYAGEVERWVTPDETLDAAAWWTDRYPEDPVLTANLAAMQIRAGQLENAKKSIARAHDLGIHGSVCDRLLGNVAWEESDPSRALEHYQRAAVHRGVLAWQIGDCYGALNNYPRALRAYRRSLRRDPFRVPAAERARAVVGWARLLPTFPPGWRLAVWIVMHHAPSIATPVLAMWRRLRPEDPYVATWIGRQALLRGDIRRADKWSFYATRFADTNRLIPNIDQLVVIVMGLMEHPGADAWSEFSEKHLDWLEEHGIPVQSDAALAVRDLFGRITYLDQQPQLDAVVTRVLRAARLSASSDE